MTLAAAPDPNDDYTPRRLPSFGGKEVKASKLKAASAAFELDLEHYNIDDIVQVTIDYRVVGVGHDVNEKNGDLERIHKFKPIDVADVTLLSGPAQDGRP